MTPMSLLTWLANPGAPWPSLLSGTLMWRLKYEKERRPAEEFALSCDLECNGLYRSIAHPHTGFNPKPWFLPHQTWLYSEWFLCPCRFQQVSCSICGVGNAVQWMIRNIKPLPLFHCPSFCASCGPWQMQCDFFVVFCLMLDFNPLHLMFGYIEDDWVLRHFGLWLNLVVRGHVALHIKVWCPGVLFIHTWECVLHSICHRWSSNLWLVELIRDTTSLLSKQNLTFLS